ncbi:protein tyrosine phosphatase receptor type C-associated protein [Esox lucius]|uniref:protein tyrosine phosphatase receptor type C-associated protein n=1 Tax=Esox lucius TaxID=8010 RepID=UPI000576B2DC|nr:protein tyrosine phosphatase receptor type C-associated protein [Esox lucius]XP_010886141.1 protein tyrosine phosphatase receptor type C-associated protein [Esox lucius]XP_010886142.1 protein tyrosine phosphatase receptor type C-associated protein [Esox lucius]XP_019899101.1 protein tyrosine phosphatase receptor type C-associated protein [Esox lucius]XP_028973472.1 protein tyrosine phosphatase receptor type C-associated protein [Esox lucius]XP_028973473.1 protein tyrosine phosphatase recept
MSKVIDETSNSVVWTLVIILVILVVLLVYLYKRLNRQTNDQYTIHNLVYGEGGARDRLRNWIRVLEVRFGRRLWLLNESEGAAGEDEKDEEEDVERASVGGDSQGGDQEGRGDDSSDDYSSLEGCDLRERVKLAEGKEERGGSVGSKPETSRDGGECEEGAVGGQESGRGGLLVDLHPFSGSAIWSGDKGVGDGNMEDVTAL